MSGKKVYGRAYPITAADAKAYRRVERRVRPNPIGVTAMASINGRGSARSARAVAQGKTRSQRIARAESVYRNGERPMAGVLKNKRKSSAKKKPSARRKISGTGFYKTKGGRYQNAKGKFVKASSVKASTSRKRKTKTAAPARRKRRATSTAAPVRRKRRRVAATATPVRRKRRRVTATATPVRRKRRRVRKNASVGYSPAYSAGRDKMARSKAAKRASATRRRRATGSSKKTIGRYKRLSVKDPKTGRKRLSYMYRTKSGKRRKIPTKAVTSSGHKTAAGVRRGRSKAAARIKREGSAFVANRSGKTSARQKRAGRRLAAFMAAKRSGKNVKQAKAAALRKVPLRRGDQFKGNAKAPVKVGKTRVRRNKRKTVRRNARRRVTRKNPYRNTKKMGAALARKRRPTSVVRKNRRRVTSNKRRTVRRNKRRTVRRNGFKAFRKNAFMANLKAALQTGLFVATGFLVHRIATNLIAEKALATTLPDNQIFQDWKKPMVGFGMLLVGIPVVGMAVPKRGIEIGAGMVASFLQSAIVAALNSAGQQELVSSVAGYSNSRAYQLRGSRRRRRRGVRGMERHATSIMPRYQPVRQMGQYSQAAAGWEQAAAGTGEYFTATGEYFTATGEYFAPQGTKGVGGYEPAGQLAMQASAGVNSVIRDGLRPDGDIDHALDVAEAAAGLGDPAAIEHRVGQQSQWIPNGPLWAGERAVRDNQGTSEISAGILQRPGGNGILSGG